jgi:hypothetical protein
MTEDVTLVQTATMTDFATVTDVVTMTEVSTLIQPTTYISTWVQTSIIDNVGVLICDETDDFFTKELDENGRDDTDIDGYG